MIRNALHTSCIRKRSKGEKNNRANTHTKERLRRREKRTKERKITVNVHKGEVKEKNTKGRTSKRKLKETKKNK